MNAEAVNFPSTGFLPLAGKTIVVHSLTYVLMGALAAHFLDYAAIYANANSGMRPFSSRWIMAGPMLQPLRGLIFASVFYQFRERLFGAGYGWLRMAWVLVGLGVLSTFAAAAGSVEGLIYTTVPFGMQLRGWLEVVPQAVSFSALLCFWVNHPEKNWLGWTLTTLFVGMMVLFGYGVLVGRH